MRVGGFSPTVYALAIEAPSPFDIPWPSGLQLLAKTRAVTNVCLYVDAIATRAGMGGTERSVHVDAYACGKP